MCATFNIGIDALALHNNILSQIFSCDCLSKNQPSSHFQISHFNVCGSHAVSIFTGFVKLI